MRCCCSGRTLWLITFVTGVFLFVLGFVFAYAAFPAIIESEVSKELNLWESDSEGRKNFVSV